MSEWDEIESDGKVRVREPKEGEYTIPSAGSGRVVCYVPGLVIGDFYRTHKEKPCVAG